MLGRRGHSRREVVVVLLIILLLSAVLLTGVQKMREAAARMTCANNLKQLALGAHNCYDANQRLPALADQGTGAPTGQGLPSVFATLTPYLEATPLYYRAERGAAHYNASSSVTFPLRYKDGNEGTQFGGIANQVWRTFLDPADATASGLRDVSMTLPDGTTGYYTTGSYAANGLLPWGIKGGPKMLSEWPAGTILFAERPQVCTTASGEVVYNLWGVGFYSPHMPAFATLTPTDPPGMWSTGQVAPAGRDGEILVRIGRADATPQPADFLTPIQFIAKGRPCDPRLPGSPHRAGMQAAMIDGSVRIFAPDTEPSIFWSACVPAVKTEGAANGR